MRYLVTIIGMICLLACSSEETTRTAETGSQMRPIAFGDAYTAEPTRSSTAYSTEQGLSEGQSIGVYAYLHDNSTWAADEAYNTANPEAPQRLIPNFMWNQKATCLEKGGNFNYSPLKYWPNETSDKVSFIAYFPYTAESPGNPESPAYPDNATGLQTLLTNEGTNNLAEDDTNLPVFRFIVKETADEQVDFLLSELLADLPNGTSAVSPSNASDRSELTVVDRVHFLFHHMTSKVEFRISADPEVRRDIAHFHLNSLSVSNLYNNGLLIPTYSAGTTTYQWTEHTTKHGVNPTYSFPVTTYVPYLLMPQTIEDEVLLIAQVSVAYC